MDRTTLKDWEDYKVQRMIDPEAAERGRLLAASLIVESAETRKRMEDKFGVEFCAKMYPEAYRSGFLKLMDRVRRAIPF